MEEFYLLKQNMYYTNDLSADEYYRNFFVST